MHNLTSNGEIVYDKGKYYHPDRYKNEKDVAEILVRRTGGQVCPLRIGTKN